jgi:hypothetical protein
MGVVLLRGFVVWLVILLAEFIQGVARGLLLEPLIGDFRARQVAVASGSLIILLISIGFSRWIGARSRLQLSGVGLLWLLLMICFEIGFGRFVMGYSWERIGADYDLLEGGLLPLGLVVMFLSPLIAAKIRG